jgi:hypothetical protein
LPRFTYSFAILSSNQERRNKVLSEWRFQISSIP